MCSVVVQAQIFSVWPADIMYTLQVCKLKSKVGSRSLLWKSLTAVSRLTNNTTIAARRWVSIYRDSYEWNDRQMDCQTAWASQTWIGHFHARSAD